VLQQKADQQASDEAEKIAKAVRASDRIPLEELAKQFNLSVGETRPGAATDPIQELANSQDLRLGQLSQPIRTDRGYVVLSIMDVQSTSAFAEVHDRVLADWKRDKATELAQAKAGELAKRIQTGEAFQAAAKALGLEAKTSDLFTGESGLSGVGSSKQLGGAFLMTVGQNSPAVRVGANWLVYRVVEKQEPNPDDFAKQAKQLQDQVLEQKRTQAFEAFRAGLEARLKQEGKLKLNPAALKTNFGGSGL
jgi:peptidyl-prolyl cis-trans isomerase D